MRKLKSWRTPPKPNFILLPPPPEAPPDPPAECQIDVMAASAEAIARAAAAALEGDLFKAEKESRLAERFDRIARRALLAPPPQREPEPDGEAFRLELERRINRFRLEERAKMDALKEKDPAAWQEAYEAARAEAREDGGLRGVEAFWTGDPRLFEEPEGGYPPSPAA